MYLIDPREDLDPGSLGEVRPALNRQDDRLLALPQSDMQVAFAADRLEQLDNGVQTNGRLGRL